MKSSAILIVEDERLIAQDLQRRLIKLGYEVCGLAASGEEAIQIAETRQPALVLIDIVLRGAMDGIETARQIKTRWQIPIVYVTAYCDDATLHRASLTGPSDYLLKPFDDRRLREAVERAFSKARAASSTTA